MVGFNCHSHNSGAQIAEYSCLEWINSTSKPENEELYCEAEWDGLGCWNFTRANTSAVIPCPLHMHGFEPGFATKFCTSEGEWWTPDNSNTSWANYSDCISDYHWEEVIVNLYIAGYSVSLVSLVLALIIFTIYRKNLRSLRISMHRHLFATYTGTSITGILYYVIVVKDVDVLWNNPSWCQVLHVSSQYFVVCNFAWMFCEGLFLNIDVVVVFGDKDKYAKMCKVIGWVTPTIITAVYAFVRGFAAKEIEMCWLVDSCTQWIMFAPIILLLFANILFLVNIVRVMCTRSKKVNYADTNHIRRTARAAAMLIPLLGLQFILFPVEPPQGTITYKIFQALSTIMVSFQGLFVSILFCFCNMEVMKLFKKKWKGVRMISTLTSFFSRQEDSSTYTSVTNMDQSESHMPLQANGSHKNSAGNRV